jgi:hypothetical protein
VLRNVLGSLTALALRSDRLTVAVCNAFHATLLRLSAAATSGALDCALQQRAAHFLYAYEEVCIVDLYINFILICTLHIRAVYIC